MKSLKCVCCTVGYPGITGQSLQTLCHRTLIMRHEFTGYIWAYLAGSGKAKWCCVQNTRQLDLGFNPCPATNWLCDPGQIASRLCVLVIEHSGQMTSMSLLFILCHSRGEIPVRKYSEKLVWCNSFISEKALDENTGLYNYFPKLYSKG